MERQASVRASQLLQPVDVPSVINGMILDTLATGGNQTVTLANPQVAQWNVRSSNTANPGVRGSGSTRSGAPSVPISETFSAQHRTGRWEQFRLIRALPTLE